MKLLANGWGGSALLLMTLGCAGHRSQPNSGENGDANDASSLSAAPSEPLRVRRTPWQGYEVAEAKVSAARGAASPELLYDVSSLETGEPPPSLMECLLDRGVFRAFTAMLLASELEGELAAGPYTVLVPNDRAFHLLPLEDRLVLFELGDISLMADMLRRHVLRGAYSADEMAEAGELRTLAGTRIRVEAIGGLPVLDGAQVLSSRQTAEGVVHEIDRVLAP